MALTKDELDQKLDELEETFRQYINKQREKLTLERKLLKTVLDTQGFSSTARRNRNTDTLTSIATVKELIPTFEDKP